MNANALTAPRMPDTINTASAPKAAASGPTTRNEIGAPRIVIIQSSDNYAAEQVALGTSVCIAVNQITTSTEMAPSAISATTIACGTFATIPKNVVMPMPIANAMYMTVSARRGRPPRCAITSDAGDRADTAGAEDERELELRARHLVGHHERHEGLPGPHTQKRLTIPASRPHFNHGVERT